MEWVDAMVEATGWQSDQVGLFGGAVTYTQYGRIERLLFKLVSMGTGLGTDTTRDYEYTDGESVERFAGEFADLVESRSEEILPRSAPSVGQRIASFALLGLAIGGV